MMDRRAFIRIVGGSVLVAPLAAEAQPAEKVYRIGYLGNARLPGSMRLIRFTVVLMVGLTPLTVDARPGQREA
jgi:hypothetical protein